MEWFHSVHCGDILELANSCVEGVPRGHKEFKKAEVINVWEICDVFTREVLSLLNKEYQHFEETWGDSATATDLWLEVRF